MAPRPMLLIFPGSKKKEPRCVCLSEAQASHSHRTWAEVSSFTSRGIHFHEVKSEGLHEKARSSYLGSLATISAFAWRRRKTKKTGVEMTGRRTFRMLTDFQPAVRKTKHKIPNVFLMCVCVCAIALAICQLQCNIVTTIQLLQLRSVQLRFSTLFWTVVFVFPTQY
jgi:hypothetical protein